MTLYFEDFIEGQSCPLLTEDGSGEPCKGHLIIKPPVDCSCHISPPCAGCVEAPLVCDTCHWEVEDLDYDA
jgi:hypothetical protein